VEHQLSILSEARERIMEPNEKKRQSRLMYALGQLDLAEEIGLPADKGEKAHEKFLKLQSEFMQHARWYGHNLMGNN
jgi:hypothetical protein